MSIAGIQQSAINKEASRLHKRLHHLGWTIAESELYAHLTAEINQLKKAQNAIILAHSYQRPEIMYGVADFIGDSYGLSVIASKTDAQKIIFCSVHFMAETAKLLNPKKEVLVPKAAGCSLAESITPQDVIELRQTHPHAGVVCYVNTSAAVKAESDACCTSSNALKVIEAMPQDEIIFIPDELMARNLIGLTPKKIIYWQGQCIVHNQFTPAAITEIRQHYPDVKILAHPECTPNVVQLVDMVGGTEAMINYVKKTAATQYMIITECGIADRVRTELPQKKVVGTCALCPYMKEIMLKDVLQTLKNPLPHQYIELHPETHYRAKRSLERMFELEQQYQSNVTAFSS